MVNLSVSAGRPLLKEAGPSREAYWRAWRRANQVQELRSCFVDFAAHTGRGLL